MRAGYSFRIILKHFKIYHYFVKRKQPTKIIFLKLFIKKIKIIFLLGLYYSKSSPPHDGKFRYIYSGSELRDMVQCISIVFSVSTAAAVTGA
jgi:hypothetical protein